MAFPKNALFSPEDQMISRNSLTLSHPARLFIARNLWEEGPKYVHDLEQSMPLVQASISHHLNTMRSLDLVHVEVQGLFNLYHLNLEKLDELRKSYEEWFLGFQKKS